MQVLRMTLATPYKPLLKPTFGLGSLTDAVIADLRKGEAIDALEKQRLGLPATASNGELAMAQQQENWAARCAAVGLPANASTSDVLLAESRKK